MVMKASDKRFFVKVYTGFAVCLRLPHGQLARCEISQQFIVKAC